MRLVFERYQELKKRLAAMFKLNSECYFTFGPRKEVVCSIVDTQFHSSMACVWYEKDVKLHYGDHDDPISSSTINPQRRFPLKQNAWLTLTKNVKTLQEQRLEMYKRAQSVPFIASTTTTTTSKANKKEKRKSIMDTLIVKVWMDVTWSHDVPEAQQVLIGIENEVCATIPSSLTVETLYTGLFQTFDELWPAAWSYKVRMKLPQQFDILCTECCELDESIVFEITNDLRFICTSNHTPFNSVARYTWPPSVVVEPAAMQTMSPIRQVYPLRFLRIATKDWMSIDEIWLLFPSNDNCTVPLYVAGMVNNRLAWVLRIVRETVKPSNVLP